MLDPALSLILTSGLALLFLAAACHKLRDWTRFRSSLEGYRVLPRALAPAAAGAVPALELLAAGLLPFAAGRLPGAAIAAALLLVYTLAIGINLRRGRTRIDCGCFGAGHRQRIAGWMVPRNLVLAGCAIAAALPVSGRALAAIDGLTIAGATVTLAIVYLAFGALGTAATRSGEAA